MGRSSGFPQLHFRVQWRPESSSGECGNGPRVAAQGTPGASEGGERLQSSGRVERLYRTGGVGAAGQGLGQACGEGLGADSGMALTFDGQGPPVETAHSADVRAATRFRASSRSVAGRSSSVEGEQPCRPRTNRAGRRPHRSSSDGPGVHDSPHDYRTRAPTPRQGNDIGVVLNRPGFEEEASTGLAATRKLMRPTGGTAGQDAAPLVFDAAHHPMGGRRPAGRSPVESTGRPVGGSTKSNTLLSPTLSTQSDGGGQSSSLGTSWIKVTGRSRTATNSDR